MLKIFFPALGVGFSELRQIVLTFCHSIVNVFRWEKTLLKTTTERSFADATDRRFCFRNRVQHSPDH